MFLWWLGKSCYSLAGKFWFTHCIHQSLNLPMSIYFSIYKIPSMEKHLIPWNIVRETGNSSLLKKIKCFGKTAIKFFNKVLGEFEYENCVLFLLKKLKELSGQIYILYRLSGWCSGTEYACQCRRYKRSGLGRSFGGGNVIPLQNSCWEIPMDWEVWWATVCGVTKIHT